MNSGKRTHVRRDTEAADTQAVIAAPVGSAMRVDVGDLRVTIWHDPIAPVATDDVPRQSGLRGRRLERRS